MPYNQPQLIILLHHNMVLAMVLAVSVTAIDEAVKEAQETMQKLEKDGIPFSARLDGEKSAVTVRKSEAPAYFSRRQMKKLAQEVKTEGTKPKEPKNKGQEL